MTESHPDPVAPADEALLEIIELYHERIDVGESVDRDAFVAQHSDHRNGLLSYFADLNIVENLAGPTIGNAAEDTVVSGETHNGVPGETMIESSQADTSNMRVAANAPRTQFGRYRLSKELGRGAMGAVYLAHDEQLDREIALKIPQFGQDMDPALLERFYREARAAAALRHPGICPVYDVGEIDGQHYITMAYIKGRPLRDFTRTTKKQGIQQVVRVIRKLAMAMAEAHKHNVTHRDLKPANVMIDERKEPVVMDFGLARRAAAGEEKLTHSGTVIGTPAYMSPEQVDGDNDRVGPPADIYSLGVMFYEMLTGQLPFQGNLMSILKQIATVDPQPPSELRAEVPAELEAVCRKMMAKQIEDRYQSMEQVATELTDFLKQKNAGTEESGVLVTSKPPAVHPKVLPQIEVTEPVTVPPAPQRAPVETPLASITPNPSAATTEYKRPSRKRKTKKKTRKSKTDNGKKFLAAGIGALVILVAGITFFVKVGKYDVKITVSDPSIALKVDGNTIVIEGEGEPLRLSAGVHELIVERAGLKTETDEFTVTKDGKTAVHVAIIDGRLKILEERGSAAGSPVSPLNRPPANWISLTDGSLATHWTGLDSDELPNGWTLTDGTITGSRNRSYIASREKFGDFELELDWNVEAGGNGGVFYRWGTKTMGQSVPVAPEYQMIDDISHFNGKVTKTSTGSVFQILEPTNPNTKPAGKWNSTRIVVRGRKVEHWLNGRKTLDYEFQSDDWKNRVRQSPSFKGYIDDKSFGGLARGRIALQNYDGRIDYRNMRIRRLSSGGTRIAHPPVMTSGTVDLKRGLVGHWNFEEGTGTKLIDSSGNKNHGTLQASDLSSVWTDDSPPVSLAGRKCLTLISGDQKAQIPSSPSLEMTDAITISGWAKVRPGTLSHDLIGKANNGGFRLMLDGRLVIAKGAGAFAMTRSANRSKRDGQWYHIAGSYEGTKLRTYLNGELTVEQDHTIPLTKQSAPISLGTFINDKLPRHVAIDDVRLYNRALTLAEIAVLAGKAANADHNKAIAE